MTTKQFSRTLPFLVLLAIPLGCASEAWNLDRYRDERSKDIEDRLTRDEPIVPNPFGKAEAD